MTYEKCSECGNKGRNKSRCWLVIGYPSWDPKSKKRAQRKFGTDVRSSQKNLKGRESAPQGGA